MMTILNLGQDVANKRELKLTAAHSLLCIAVKMHRYGSLFKFNPSGLCKPFFKFLQILNDPFLLTVQRKN